MNNCKACGLPVLEDSKIPDFCSENCFWDFQDFMEGRHAKDGMVYFEDDETKPFGFEFVLNKRNKFFISDKSLNEVKDLPKFQKLLSDKNLMVVRLENGLNVIKKNFV